MSSAFVEGSRAVENAQHFPRLVARRRQDFLSSDEILFFNDDLLRATARQAVHHPDAEVRRPQIAREPFRSQERDKQFRFVSVRHNRQMNEPRRHSLTRRRNS